MSGFQAEVFQLFLVLPPDAPDVVNIDLLQRKIPGQLILNNEHAIIGRYFFRQPVGNLC